MGPDGDDASLVMIGSVRKHKKGDTKRVDRLLARARELGIEVTYFHSIKPFDSLRN